MLSDQDKEWVSQQLERDRQWMIEQLERERHWMLEQLKRVETRLLTEFHTGASPVELRTRTRAAVQCVLNAEMESLHRITKLEDQPPVT